MTRAIGRSTNLRPHPSLGRLRAGLLDLLWGGLAGS